MNRETELHFSGIPTIHRPRSKMVIPNDLLTSFDAAQCVPIYCDPDILPGDTVKMKMASVVRMATPLYPIFGNIVMDIMFFFIPHRLVWDHWREFWGENKNTWYQQTEYLVPHIKTDANHKFVPKSLGDYLGDPVGIAGISVNALPYRAYVKVWNDWFRSESLQQEAAMITTDTDVDAYQGLTTPNLFAYRGGGLLNANKLMDYFTGALPAPQKGPDVTIPLGSWAPVVTRTNDITENYYPSGIANSLNMKPLAPTVTFTEGNLYNITGKAISNSKLSIGEGPTGTTGDSPNGLYPSNLWSDLSNATSATINSLRTAFAIQRFYEAQARGGSRYIEFIRNIFGVTSPDGRLQRSEYLGGKRVPINIQTVLKTGSTDETAPLGMTGAYSHTADADEYFTHSFTEHGTLLGIATIRYYHSYNQGIPRSHSRRKFTDFYVPQFANLGEMPVLVKELYATGTNEDEEVFGYQEAWAGGYRYHPNMVTGAMRTTYAQSLDNWHLADHYTDQPILGSSWIQEDKSNIDRTLAVTSDVENQFFGDFYFRPVYTRVMPLYSIPGLTSL